MINGFMRSNMRLVLLIFSLFFLVNITYSGGHFDLFDGPEAFLVTESMVLKHTAQLDPTIPSIEKLHFDIRYSLGNNNALHPGKRNQNTNMLEPVYTVRSLLLSAAAVPFYLVAAALSVPPIPIIALFFNSTIISLISVVVFLFSVELFGSKKIAFVLSLIIGVCSFLWPYHTSFWSMPLQTLCIISSAYFIYKSRHYHFSFICNYIRTDHKNDTSLPNNHYNNKANYYAGLGGLFLGLSVFAHPTSLILVPGFIVYCLLSPMRRNKKSFASLLGALVISLFFAGMINYLRFGSFTEFGYGYQESFSVHNGWTGLLGLIASPGAGLIFYFPLAILSPIAFRYFYGRSNSALFFLSVYVILADWLYIGTLSFPEPFASSQNWSGGIAWGPRYMIPILPFIVIPFGALLQHLQIRERVHKKKIFLNALIIILCIAGFFVNLLGSLVWIFYGFTFALEREGLLSFSKYEDVLTWNPNYSPINLQLKALLSNYVTQIYPGRFAHMPFWSSLEQGIAPCQYDSYTFCKFGILPIFLSSALTAVLAGFIIMEINDVSFKSLVIRIKNSRVS